MDEAENEKIEDQSAADQTQSKEDQVEAMEVDGAEAADKVIIFHFQKTNRIIFEFSDPRRGV